MFSFASNRRKLGHLPYIQNPRSKIIRRQFRHAAVVRRADVHSPLVRPMIQALIFDCDGTLTDSMPLHFLAWNQTMRRFGIEFSEDRFYELGGIPSDKIIQMLAEEANMSLDVVAVTLEKEQVFLDSMHLLVEIAAITSIVRENKGKLPM